MLRVGGVGSRDYKKLNLVHEFVDALPNTGVLLISGGARGVDHAFAGGGEKWRGKQTEIHRPQVKPGCTKEEYAAAAYARNKTIAARSQVLIAFWDYNSRGTANTIAHACALGRTVFVIGPHGENFAEALAGTLFALRPDPVSQKLKTTQEDLTIGRLLRKMPVNNRILRLPCVDRHGKSEFTIYNRLGEVQAFSEDPHAALLSAFGRYDKGESCD